MEQSPKQSTKVQERHKLVSAPNADTFISVGQICMFMHLVFVIVFGWDGEVSSKSSDSR